MNEANVEHLLRSMRPVAPSADLTQRVQHDLELAAFFRDADPVADAPASKKRSPWQLPVVWASLGAAAAVLVMSVMHATSTDGITGAQDSSLAKLDGVSTASMPRDAILPVNSSREWVGVEDGGISFASPDSPQRQMRVRSVERHQWVDPRDGAEYTVEVPKVDSVVLPVKYQ